MPAGGLTRSTSWKGPPCEAAPSHRDELLARLHVGLRPKLTKQQVRDLGLVHIGNLDTITRGEASEEILWQWVGGAWTWAYVASALERRDPSRFAEASAAMRLQLEVCEAVVERFGRTRCIAFSGQEYQQARDACEWMDALAEVVDQPTALRAADVAERRVEEYAAKHLRQEQAA